MLNNNNELKVLHCIHSLCGGGAERQLNLLLNEIIKTEKGQAVFCVNDDGSILSHDGITLYRSKKKSKISIFNEIKSAIDDFEPTIIHAWLPSSITIPAMIVGKIKNIPVIFSYRNKMKFSRPLMVIEYITAWLCASAIISNNDVLTSSIQYRMLYQSKLNKTIPNAVKIDSKYKKNKSNNRLTKNILFVGRLTFQKNWKCLLNALAEVIKLHNDANLTVCGDGEDRDDFINITNILKLESHISLRGYEKDVYHVMKSSDVLVLPSWYEGMPNVLLEALEIGLPCIVSDIDANRFVITDSNAVIFFDPKKPADLAEKINLFFSEKNHSRMIMNGNRLASQFTTNKMAENYIEFYKNI